jgi:hypothetical protein
MDLTGSKRSIYWASWKLAVSLKDQAGNIFPVLLRV